MDVPVLEVPVLEVPVREVPVLEVPVREVPVRVSLSLVSVRDLLGRCGPVISGWG